MKGIARGSGLKILKKRGLNMNLGELEVLFGAYKYLRAIDYMTVDLVFNKNYSRVVEEIVSNNFYPTTAQSISDMVEVLLIMYTGRCLYTPSNIEELIKNLSELSDDKVVLDIFAVFLNYKYKLTLNDLREYLNRI